MANEQIRCGKCGADNWVDPYRTTSCKKCGAPIKGTKSK
jgi:ribosomal protein L40E